MTVRSEFDYIFDDLITKMMSRGEEVEVGEWQSQDVRDAPHMVSRELRHVTLELTVPEEVSWLQKDFKPNLPWAEDHFLERVSGEPLNPPPSEAWWPFRVNGNAAHKEGEQFSHTYPERMWPKWAAVPNDYEPATGYGPRRGVRYDYGDLLDVVDLLTRNRLTRQAYLPIWFPEDTGVNSGQRVPCTLGYHFLCRNGVMEIVYYIRSCDLLRHFADDVYMAGRLLQWVVGKLRERSLDVRVGTLIMHISSLHVFRGDYPRLERMIADMEDEVTYGSAF